MRRLQLVSIAALAAAGFVAADARATLIAFTNRAAFEAAAGGSASPRRLPSTARSSSAITCTTA